ncbi:ABC transporter permease [Metamycoplasma gateae]|uniref:ABC transporter permease n=1 Tax=Metamycoplasma gateae TaxID=35769 RepID=A0ABZ2AL51_9BACT|nr:ABC transporter permease [Metamycoplasma gateae]
MNEILLSQNNSAEASKSSGHFLIYSLVLTVLFIVNIYLLIKFFVNFKRSIDKTKTILKEYLIKRYVQGFKVNSTAFFNIIMISLLTLVQIIFSSVSLSKIYSTNNQNNNTYVSFFVASIVAGAILALSFGLSLLIIFIIKFNYPQYKKHLEEIKLETISLKESKLNELDNNYPKNINIDFDKLKSSNILLFNLFKQWIKNYNTLNEIDFKKQYNIFLDQLFKINYFEEFMINEQKQNDLNEQKNNENNLEKNNYLSVAEKEIAWMQKVDQKAKIMNDEKNLSKISKEEFNKKYEEYVYSVRSLDPLYQNTSKNSWLFYRDSQTEDLFYNTNTVISFSFNDDLQFEEYELLDFLKVYRNCLISKFLLTK